MLAVTGACTRRCSQSQLAGHRACSRQLAITIVVDLPSLQRLGCELELCVVAFG
jgi:hypothetical protein